MKSWVFEQYESHAVLFGNYYYLLYYLVPLLVFGYVLSSYFKGLYRTVLPNVLNDIGLRIAQTLMLGLFYFEWIDFKQFMYLFVLSYFVINLIMVVYLLFIKELNFGKSEEIVKLNKPIEMVKYGGVNFLSGLASGLTNKIDVLMLSSMVVCVVCTGNEGLEAVAVYSWALNISAFIEMPARAVAGIGLALIGQAWKENNLNDISSLYKSSSLTQLIIGLLIFACIWINVDLLFIIKPEYSEAKWAILFLGIGKLLDAASGLNYHIIATSKYYFILTGFLIFLGVSTYFTNLIFIPKFGVMGAAIATGLTLVLYNVIAFVFLLSKYKMQPFSMQTFYVLALGMGIYGIIQLLIDFENVILTSIVQTVLFSLLYIGAILYFKVSTDISNLVHKLLKFKMNRAN
jgi:O-antigen/teichoic acid export membrane protein